MYFSKKKNWFCNLDLISEGHHITETAKSKQMKYCQRSSMLYLLIQCDDCNHINRNTTSRQDKMLIRSMTDWMSKVTTSLKLTNVSQIVSMFAIISETVSSPPTRIKWIYYPCTYKVVIIWSPWYFLQGHNRSWTVYTKHDDLSECVDWLCYDYRKSG